MVVFWYNKVLQVLDVEVAIFQCPVCLRTAKTMRYGPSQVCMDPPKGEREAFGEELGAIRGLWEAP